MLFFSTAGRVAAPRPLLFGPLPAFSNKKLVLNSWSQAFGADYNDDYCLLTIIFYRALALLKGKMFCEDDHTTHRLF